MTMTRIPVLASLAALLTLSACGDDDGGTPLDTDGTTGADDGATGATTTAMPPADDGAATTDGTGTGDTTGAPADTAMIRLVHAAPEAPPVDVYIEGTDTPIITGLAYGDATEYLEVDAGEYIFELRPTGAAATDPPVFVTDSLSVPAGAEITAVAAGLLMSEGEDDDFRIIPLVEEFDAPASGSAIVRVVHAGSDAPTVGIDVGNDGSVEVASLERFEDTGATGVEIPAGASLQVGLVANGETVTAFTTPELPEGAELFVIATGLLDRLPREEAGFSLLAVGPTGAIGFVRQNPRLYALHASPDAGDVDICTAGLPLLANIEYGTMAPVQVPPGAYELALYPAGLNCDGPAVGTFDTGDLAAGEQYLSIATGEVVREDDDPPLALVTYPERFSLDATPGSGVLRVIHAASAPEIAVGVVADGQIEEVAVLIPSLAWPNESDELEVPAMTYMIGIVPADATFPVAPFASFEVPVADGGRAWTIAAGQIGADPSLTLWSVDTTVSPWMLTDVGMAED